MKSLRAAEFGNDVMGSQERKTAFENSERIAAVTLWEPSSQNLNLAVREKCFLRNRTRRLEANPNCFVACRRSDERMPDMLN